MAKGCLACRRTSHFRVVPHHSFTGKCPVQPKVARSGALTWASQCSSGHPDRVPSRLNLRIRRRQSGPAARSTPQTLVLTGPVLPIPGVAMGFRLARARTGNWGPRQVGPRGKIEHARVGGPVGQGAGCVAGPHLAEHLQQRCDALQVIEAGLGGPVGQGAGRVTGPASRSIRNSISSTRPRRP